MRGADLIVKTLVEVGVSKIFSLSGNQIMPIYDACINANIEIIHTRHEASAVFMADAYAQLTGKIGVCLVTAGPGMSNALGPLYTARQSESPVLLLTGDSPTNLDKRGAFQELDQITMTAVMTKKSFRATSIKDLGDDLVHAIKIATSGRPGPVHVALPFDVIQRNASGVPIPKNDEIINSTHQMGNKVIDNILRILNEAEFPVIITGPALSITRTGNMQKKLSTALNTPIITMESPRGLNDPALGDLKQVLARADLIFCLGKPVNYSIGFGDTTIFNDDVKWIVVDAEVSEINRACLNLGARLELSFITDPKDFAFKLIDENITIDRSVWFENVTKLLAKRNYLPNDTHPIGKITPASLCAILQKKITSMTNTVVICDGGEFGQWCQAGITADYRIINGPSGAIGGALCYGIAAKKAFPDSNVFSLMGDGTVGFHFAEFETAVRSNTPFVVVIGNDECWNAEYQIQIQKYGIDRAIGCNLSGARYDKAVEAMGGHGEFVTKLTDLDAALNRAVNSGKVACINVLIEGIPAPDAS